MTESDLDTGTEFLAAISGDQEFVSSPRKRSASEGPDEGASLLHAAEGPSVHKRCKSPTHQLGFYEVREAEEREAEERAVMLFLFNLKRSGYVVKGAAFHLEFQFYMTRTCAEAYISQFLEHTTELTAKYLHLL
jgi:hypothetical protein